MNNLFFEYPWVLWLELLLVPMAAWYIWKQVRRRRPYVAMSTTAPFSAASAGLARVLRHLPAVLRMIAVALLIVAMARPRSSSDFSRTDTEGIDIVLALDVSTSMLARDFTPDRIEAAKNIAIEFISQRPSDRIGVVVFAGESYTQSPLTTDRGLANAVARLKDSQAKSRVVILLTDGVNNRGEIAPLTAAEIAKTYGIRVYTIGVGAMGTAPYPVMTPFGVQVRNIPVEIDEKLLEQIAEQTGGSYFRATDNTKLLQIYGEINEMEKVKITVDSFPVYTEEFDRFAVWALAAFLLEIILRIFAARRIA